VIVAGFMGWDSAVRLAVGGMCGAGWGGCLGQWRGSRPCRARRTCLRRWRRGPGRRCAGW